MGQLMDAMEVGKTKRRAKQWNEYWNPANPGKTQVFARSLKSCSNVPAEYGNWPD
jgi:hypothetical protein